MIPNTMKLENYSDLNQNHRMTHQRRVILEEIKKTDSHPTADEVYELVRKRLPKISLGTVYRNLEILSSGSLIKKIGPTSTQMRFDGNTENHYHIRCIKCGKLDDFPAEPVVALNSKSSDFNGYLIMGHSVEFFGYCPECTDEMDNTS